MIRSFTPVASSSDGCSYILEASDGQKLLLDAGARFDDIQKASDFSLPRFAGCLMTHAHGDHSKVAQRLCRAGMDVYATEEAWLEVPFESHRRRVVVAKANHEVGSFSVMPFSVQHDSPGTVGYLIGHGDDRAVYMTDTSYCKYKFPKVTHLFVECNHSTAIMRRHVTAGDISTERYARVARNHMALERLLDFLKANDLSKVKETWLLHLSSGNSDEEQFKAEVRAVTGSPVYVAAKRSSS